jgi:hypothetical protein
MKSMPRVKFQKPMSPRVLYALTLEHDRARGRITFAFTEAATGQSCSSGKIDLRATE